MNIQNTLRHCLPLASLQTTAEIDAEIREELEFHLHMRTQDNLGAGMLPEEAHRDALQRFGNFETQRRACRKITLGPRLLLHRIQTGLLIVLLGTVIYQAVLLFSLQTSSRNEIESLTQLVKQLRADQQAVSDDSARIPYVHWKTEPPLSTTAKAASTNTRKLLEWDTAATMLQQPWSDWSTLSIQAEHNESQTSDTYLE